MLPFTYSCDRTDFRPENRFADDCPGSHNYRSTSISATVPRKPYCIHYTPKWLHFGHLFIIYAYISRLLNVFRRPKSCKEIPLPNEIVDAVVSHLTLLELWQARTISKVFYEACSGRIHRLYFNSIVMEIPWFMAWGTPTRYFTTERPGFGWKEPQFSLSYSSHRDFLLKWTVQVEQYEVCDMHLQIIFPFDTTVPFTGGNRPSRSLPPLVKRWSEGRPKKFPGRKFLEAKGYAHIHSEAVAQWEGPDYVIDQYVPNMGWEIKWLSDMKTLEVSLPFCAIAALLKARSRSKENVGLYRVLITFSLKG